MDDAGGGKRGIGKEFCLCNKIENIAVFDVVNVCPFSKLFTTSKNFRKFIG